MFMARACGRDQHHVAPRIVQRPEVDRDRLRVAEQKGRMQKKQQPWEQDRPDGSMCFSGLKVTRPSRQAVSSPKRRATKPCAASWNVMAMIAGRAQTEIV